MLPFKPLKIWEPRFAVIPASASKSTSGPEHQNGPGVQDQLVTMGGRLAALAERSLKFTFATVVMETSQ